MTSLGLNELITQLAACESSTLTYKHVTWHVWIHTFALTSCIYNSSRGHQMLTCYFMSNGNIRAICCPSFCLCSHGHTQSACTQSPNCLYELGVRGEARAPVCPQYCDKNPGHLHCGPETYNSRVLAKLSVICWWKIKSEHETDLIHCVLPQSFDPYFPE